MNTAFSTRQFWLLWVVLCMNVTAGIGVLGQASPMIQEMFPGRVTAAAAGGFVGLLSIFNMGGRFVWASTSDYIGRRNTYMVFFALGIVLYALVPTTGHMGSITLFVAGFAIVLSMYARVRDHPGLSAGHVRHDACGRHPRQAIDRVVGRRRVGTGAGQLHPAIPDR